MNAIYVLVTAARNEEDYIERTLKSVVSQTILPKKWIIVCNNCTDNTEKIVSSYSGKYGFIQLKNLKGDESRNTAAKVFAINAGLELIKDLNYQFVGNIDADIELESDYFERLIMKFIQYQNLGIAGGWINELQNGITRERFGNSEQRVPGSVQMFRRECFEMIGGYMPLRTGGEDSTAEVTARMYGWVVKSFPDLKVLHNRITSIEKCNILYTRFRQGKEDYYLGNHPLFEVFKFIKRTRERPFFIGSIFRIIGYLLELIRNRSIIIPTDVVRHLRKEQMIRVKSLFKL